MSEQSLDYGRPAVRYMLQKWPEDLSFWFCPLPDPAIDLERLEKELIAAIDPPANWADLPAVIASARRAFR